MVQSPSLEANRFAASQEIPHISRNPNVHYRTDKRPPPVPILGQPNPVHIPTSQLLEIHPNTIYPSTPRSPQWSLSLRLPHQDPIHPLSSPIRSTCPAHLIIYTKCTEYHNHLILSLKYKKILLEKQKFWHAYIQNIYPNSCYTWCYGTMNRRLLWSHVGHPVVNIQCLAL